MKNTLFSIVFALLCADSFAQNYFTMKKNTEARLAELHKTMPDSLFYHEGSEYSQFMQWVDYWEQRVGPTGDFNNYYTRLKASRERLAQRAFSLYNVDWQEVGPTDEPSGVMAANVGQSAGIGPVEFVRFYRSVTTPAPNHMLCGSTKGGLFYSSDGGNTWVNAGSDHWSGVSNVSWAEFKVDDPEVIYAVSGEPKDNTPGPIQDRGGIFRVQKSGPVNPNTQWTQIADYTDFGGHKDCWINKILTDPYDPNILYAATTWGLFKSSNVNAVNPTWVNILPNDGAVWDVEIRPGAGYHLTLYASFDSESPLNEPNPNPSPISNMVKYSQNGGGNWSVLPNSPSTLAINNSSSKIPHISIEVSSAALLQQNIYLFYYGLTPASKNIYRYDFGSQSSYTKINQCGIDNLSCGSFSTCCFGSGSAFGVSQSGPSEVVFVAFGDRYARYVNGTQTLFGHTNPNKYDYHVDAEGFTFNPLNASEIWMASHGGPYKSMDQGSTWMPKMKGVGVAMVFHMATSYESPEDILIGTYHDGDILTEGPYTNNWNPTWKYVYGADGDKVLIDNKDPKYMYASGVGSPWARSDDSGATVTFPGIGFYTGNGWFQHVAVLNKESTNIIYGKRNGEVIRATDRGNSSGNVISNIASLAGANPSCSGVENIFAFEGNKDLLMASFYNCSDALNSRQLYYTLKATDPAINPVSDWKKINLGNGNRSIYDVEIDPLDSRNIYVVLYPDWSASSTKVVNKVEDFANAQTVIDLTRNFPSPFFQRDCLVLEKGSNGGIYVATDGGAVFYTNNKLLLAGLGNEWVQFGDDYPHVTTNGLEINFKVNKIRAAPYSRGVWQADLYCPPDLTFNETGTYTANQFLEAKNWITSNATINSGLDVKYRAGDQIVLSSSFFAKPGSNFYAFIHPCDKPGNSFK